MAHAGSSIRAIRLLGLGGALIAGVALTGCSTSSYVDCPAIGWGNTVTVALDGAIGDVSAVQMCVDDQCSIPAPGQSPTDGPGQTDDPGQMETPGPQDPESHPPIPSAWETPYFASPIDDDLWEIGLTMERPENVTLRALSAIGEVLAEEDVALAWVRLGGSEQCGGPAEAGPVVLTIAS